jgi:hypothetical protein
VRVSRFSFKIDDRPMLLALLNVAEIQINCFMPAQTTRE